MGTHSSDSRRSAKPEKPWPGYPLFAHSNGQWAKKIRGRVYYFGPWRNPEAAFDRYRQDRTDLEAGRTPQRQSDSLTVRQLINLCLSTKEAKVESGELRRRTFEEYYIVARRIARVFGVNRLVEDLTPADFLSLRKDFAKTHKSLAP